MKNSIESKSSSPEQRERGKNVITVLKVMRHGERTPDGYLTNYGREVTREKARESGIKQDDFDAVKAGGSKSGPLDPETKMPRSLETADIYAKEIAGDKAFRTRERKALTFENLVTPAPMDWTKTYNSYLPENFDSLSDEEKSRASKKAQQATLNKLINLNTPEAETFRKEAAGSLASEIVFYDKRNRKLYLGSKVLEPLGSHGGIMEFILQQALVWKDKEGRTHTGFTNLDEIGGGFDPSDSFNIYVATDSEGNTKTLKVTFDNPNRPQGEMYLDPEKVKELAEFYQELHKQDDDKKDKDSDK